MKKINKINLIAEIFATITSILDKVESVREKINPEICRTIANEIKDHYLNSELDPQPLLISYRLFKGIAGLLDSSIENVTPQRLDQLIETTKRYYFDNKTNFKLLKESLELYKDLDENLNDDLRSS